MSKQYRVPRIRIETDGRGTFAVRRKRRFLPGWKTVGGAMPAMAVLAALKMVLPTYAEAYKVFDAFCDEIGAKVEYPKQDFEN